MSTPWVCAECENENPTSADPCEACDAPRPAAGGAGGDVSSSSGYKVGFITSCEPIAGKDKLRKLVLDIGAAAPITVVTNAPNVAEGVKVVVATIGTEVGEIVIKKTAVGGVVSEGMLAEPKNLGWVGGGAGIACVVPDSFAPGDAPPSSRPRMDGK